MTDEIQCSVPIPFDLLRDLTEIDSGHTPTCVVHNALRFALINKEFWCPDTSHTQEASTPSPS